MVVRIRIILVLLLFSVSLFAQEGADSLSPAGGGQQDSVAGTPAEAKVILNVEVDSATGIHAQVTSEGGDQAAAETDTTGIVHGMKGAETIDKLKDTVSFSKIFWSVIFLLAGYLFIKYSVKLMDLFAESSTRVRLGVKRFIPIYRIIVWTLVIFIVIKGVISPSWEAVVALGASVGVAVGFAAQDILKNIFGGFTILAEKPFQVGDKINTGDHYGEVLHIGFRSTRIVTSDDSTVTIPNAELTSKAVSNANYGESNCQVVAEIYLPPDIDTGAVRKIAMEAAQVSSLVYLKKPVSVLFVHEMKERRPFLKMRLKAYVLDIRYEFALKSEMTEIVLHELYKQGLIRPEEAT